MSNKNSPGNKSLIPKVPRIDIEQLAKRIDPVITIKGKKFYIARVGLFAMSFLWDPTPTVEANGLSKLCDIQTYHTYGVDPSFKPSVAEVLAQIPKNHLSRVAAFEIIDFPQSVETLKQDQKRTGRGYHQATTRLYTRA